MAQGAKGDCTFLPDGLLRFPAACEAGGGGPYGQERRPSAHGCRDSRLSLFLSGDAPGNPDADVIPT